MFAMDGLRRQRFTAAIGLIAVLAAASPALAQWSLSRLGGGAALDQAGIDSGLVIVVVWTSWSPRGRDIVERLNRIEQRWGSQARVVSVVFQESPEAVNRFLQGKKLDVPVFLDSGNAEFSKRYNVTQVPRLLVFKDGVTAVNVNLTDDPDPLIAGAVG
jgi:thiol-disulfide isomerase/thioredoxin